MDADNIISREPAAWERLRQAVALARPLATVEAPNRCHDMSDEAVWKVVVGQVAVIGRSAPWERLSAAWPQAGLGYQALLTALHDGGIDSVGARVEDTFRNFRVRYARGGDERSSKAVAVAENLRRLHVFGGPKNFFACVARLDDERARWRLVQDVLFQLGSKGSRDVLMGLGLLRNAIALDARVLRILKEAQLLVRNPRTAGEYDRIEEAILEQACRPLGWDGIEFDRSVYQHAHRVTAALRG